MYIRLRQCAAPAAAIALFSVAPAVQAASVLLSDLISSNGSIVQGDKLFSNFSYTFTGEMPDATGVNVTGVTISGNYGVEFSGAFTDTSASAGGSDATIKYDVTVLDPNYRITDAHLLSNIAGNGLGSGTIRETFLPDFPILPPHAPYLSNFDFNNVAFQLHDSYVWGLPGYTSLHVQKDILLNATAAVLPGFNELDVSVIDQTYSQSAIVVPIPPAVAGGLGLLSILGFNGVRRQRLMAGME